MGPTLVTGGAGFIGSQVVEELLRRGERPVVLDDLSTGRRDNLPRGVPLEAVDLRNREAVVEVMRRVRPRVVCHLAAQVSVNRSMREPSFDASVNVLGTVHVLEAAAEAGAERVVSASSGGVLYGECPRPARETDPLGPVSAYGLSKWTCEQYGAWFARERGLHGVALRYANVYGPRQDPHGEAGVVAIFARHLLEGRAPTIHGDGRAVRDYVYVTDVARATVQALEAPMPAPFTPLNIGTGVGTDVNRLEERLRAAFARLRPDAAAPRAGHGPPRAGDLRSNLVDPRRAGEVLGWLPEVGLDEGLGATVAWFAAQGK